MSDIVETKDFIPYTLEDFGVIIPHPSRYEDRWKYFWPWYKDSVPKEILKNTVIVYHDRDKQPTTVPSEVMDCGANVYYLRKEGRSVVWPTVEGLKYLKTRLIARVCDDTRFETANWVQRALEIFNQEPHFKILASLTLGGPSPEQIKSFKLLWDQPWYRKLLKNGNFKGMEYISPSNWITNRSIWMGYYYEMEEHTIHDLDDVLFTLLSHADGAPIIRFDFSSFIPPKTK